jgi:hypothetical protein
VNGPRQLVQRVAQVEILGRKRGSGVGWIRLNSNTSGGSSSTDMMAFLKVDLVESI